MRFNPNFYSINQGLEILQYLTPIFAVMGAVLFAGLVIGIIGAVQTKRYRELGWNALKGKRWLSIGVTALAGLLGGIDYVMAMFNSSGASSGLSSSISSSINSSGFSQSMRGMPFVNRMPNGFSTGDFFHAAGPAFAAIAAIMGVLMVLGSIYAIAKFVVGSGVMLGYYGYYLDLNRGREARFGRMFSEFKRLGKAIGMRLLRGLIIAAWSLIAIVPAVILVVMIIASAFGRGYSSADEALMAASIMRQVAIMLPIIIAACIPAMIAQYRYAMAGLILSENPDIKVTDALKRSTELMRGHKWELFLLEQGFIGWNWLFALSFITIILILPVFGVILFGIYLTTFKSSTVAAFYLSIAGRQRVLEGAPEEAPVEPAPQPEPEALPERPESPEPEPLPAQQAQDEDEKQDGPELI